MKCNILGGTISVIVGLVIIAGLIYLWYRYRKDATPEKPASGWLQFFMFCGICTGFGLVTGGVNSMSTVNPYD